LLPNNFLYGKNLRRTGTSGLFAGSLELVKEGNISIKQKKLYDDIYIKQNNE
jgi:segregation and condensation protein A